MSPQSQAASTFTHALPRGAGVGASHGVPWASVVNNSRSCAPYPRSLRRASAYPVFACSSAGMRVPAGAASPTSLLSPEAHCLRGVISTPAAVREPVAAVSASCGTVRGYQGSVQVSQVPQGSAVLSSSSRARNTIRQVVVFS